MMFLENAHCLPQISGTASNRVDGIVQAASSMRMEACGRVMHIAMGTAREMTRKDRDLECLTSQICIKLEELMRCCVAKVT